MGSMAEVDMLSKCLSEEQDRVAADGFPGRSYSNRIVRGVATKMKVE